MLMNTCLPLRLSSLQVALLTLGLTIGAAAPLAAQGTWQASFDSTESALTGTVACNGGSATPISSVDASTTDVTGSNDAVASNLSATACGLPLYAIASANDASSASDTPTLVDGAGTSALSQFSLLGGLVTYTAKTETDNCTANLPAWEVNCTDTTTIQNLYFAGQHITGTFTHPTTFNAVNVAVQLPGQCTGVALFTGQLTVAGSSVQTSGNTADIQITPVALQGTLTCIGLPLTTMTVNLADLEAAICLCTGIEASALDYDFDVAIKLE
jgi:hypothetical protein